MVSRSPAIFSAIAALLAGCGRIDFDALADAHVSGPAHRFLYDTAGSQIYGYELDLATGLPTALATVTVPATAMITAIATDPLGRFAYVADPGGSQLFVLAIDPATGALALTNTFADPSLVKPTALVVDPPGEYLYAVDDAATAITALAIDPATGALGGPIRTPTGVTAPYATYDLRFDAHDHLYVALDDNNGGVAGWLAMKGEMVPIAGSPWNLVPIGSGPDPYQIAIHPSGRWLFMSDQGNAKTLWAALDPVTGQLTPQPVQLSLGGGLIFGLAFDDAGTHLYEADCSGSDRAFVVDVDPATGTQTSAGMGPQTGCLGAVHVDSPHSLLFVDDESNGLYAYALLADGSIGAELAHLPGPGTSLFAIANTVEP